MDKVTKQNLVDGLRELFPEDLTVQDVEVLFAANCDEEDDTKISVLQFSPTVYRAVDAVLLDRLGSKVEEKFDEEQKSLKQVFDA